MIYFNKCREKRLIPNQEKLGKDKKGRPKNEQPLCARGGNRTRTCIAANRILSPACLPVPPPGQDEGKKIPLWAGNTVKSGRPGSNRLPRPWQGRALPNELLPLLKKN